MSSGSSVPPLVQPSPPTRRIASERFNGAAERLLGHTAKSIIGGVFHQVLVTRDVFGNRLHVAAGIQEMVRTGEPVQAFEIEVRAASGSRKRVRVSVLPVIGPEPSQYSLVYHLIPRRRRGRAEEAIDLLIKDGGDSGLSAIAADRGVSTSEAPLLTDRQRELLRLLASGRGTAEIADSLRISVNTVRSHGRNILRKLGAHSRAEAISVAFHRGLVWTQSVRSLATGPGAAAEADWILRRRAEQWRIRGRDAERFGYDHPDRTRIPRELKGPYPLEEGAALKDVFEIVEAARHPVFATDGSDLTLVCNRAAEWFLGLGRECIVAKAFHQLVETRDAIGTRLGKGTSLHERVLRGDPISALELYVRDASGELVRVAVGLVVVRKRRPSRDRLVYHLLPRPSRRRADRVIDHLLSKGNHLAPKSAGVGSSGTAASLTRREREVLRRVATGDDTREISRSLGLSINTVRSHLKKVFRKLAVHSRAEAVSLALQQHLI